MSSAARRAFPTCRDFEPWTPPSATLDIRDAADAVEALRAANARRASLAIVGAGSKSRLGRHAPQPQVSLDARASPASRFMSPMSLCSRRAPARRLLEIEALLEAHGQQLAFEPMDYAPLLGGAKRSATIGGVIAVNASGPRRIKAGAARDHLLGFHCVTGRGEEVKSGGRVMKNVTGYDLSKLVCGSFGTLALLTDVTLKVLPKPETEQTLLVTGLDEAGSLALLRRAAATPCEVSSFAMLPAGAALGVRRQCGGAASRRAGDLRDDAPRRSHRAPGGWRREIRNAESAGFSGACGDALRDAAPVAAHAGQVWRLSVAPTDGFAVVERIRRAGAPLRAHFYDWAGGLIWLCLEPAPDAHAATVRAAVDASGGHATLIRASEETRAAVEVFHPQPAALAALTRRVKESFDPAHVLERGRMRAEF